MANMTALKIDIENQDLAIDQQRRKLSRLELPVPDDVRVQLKQSARAYEVAAKHRRSAEAAIDLEHMLDAAGVTDYDNLRDLTEDNGGRR